MNINTNSKIQAKNVETEVKSNLLTHKYMTALLPG